ncbi:helical backbone metal receptor [Weeksella virosa]|uniref:heme/hemin ABC transporter substrate-binding protein n=1 Tax=Weeksella virosa TaxID=1014 RepID=UPI0025552431|nr:helical backbone metal receptor [Weeksella virosa]MDK7374361.1 helical backbone metal receptor [Weeksella virosa]
MKKIILLGCTLTFMIACNSETKTEDTQKTTIEKTKSMNTERIVSLNGSVTETLALLGKGGNIVGVDITSTFPQNIKEQAANLGHVSSISAESILALKPTLVYATSKEMKPELQKQLEQAKVTVRLIDQPMAAEETKKMIAMIATDMHSSDYEKYLTEIDKKIQQVKPVDQKPKVLFIYARGAGNLMIAGQNTPIENIIEMAGGINAVNNIEDYKPLTPEALINANPDYILLFDRGLQSLGGEEGVLKIEGVSATNAGKKMNIISMDGQLLSGFGPRLGEATLQLNQLLQGK